MLKFLIQPKKCELIFYPNQFFIIQNQDSTQTQQFDGGFKNYETRRATERRNAPNLIIITANKLIQSELVNSKK
jgi:hypothetical protein